MKTSTLKFIRDLMNDLGIHYEFMNWTDSPVETPYFTGEYTEINTGTLEENGSMDNTLMLTGIGTSFVALETAKETILDLLPIETVLSDGTGIAIYYESSFPVPIDDYRYKSIQINLSVKEWRI